MGEEIREIVKYYRRLAKGGRNEPDFFELVRRIELAEGRRDVGKSSARFGEPVRFGQMPHLNFAESAVAEISDRARPDILVNFFGLWGPQGPMPLEMTGWVYQRMHNHGDNAHRRFADILHHRFLGLYYRAWKANEQAALFDKPDGGLAARVASALAGETCRGARVSPFASARWSGILGARAKSCDGLTTLLRSAFDVPITVRCGLESSGWIPEESHCRLGLRGVAELGVSAQLGRRFRTRCNKFEVEVGPVPFRQVAKLLPGASQYRQLVGLVHSYLNRPFEWNLVLLVKCGSLPAPRLDGNRQLGRSVWLGRPKSETDRLVVGASRLAESAQRRAQSLSARP